MLSPSDQKALDALHELCQQQKYHNIGYPENADFDYSTVLRFMEFSMNNVGDPFAGSTYLLNSLTFEKEVVEFFAELFRIRPADCWGYVTSGGTEGNLFGVYLGRELFPDGVLYCSDETHYSVDKIARILRVPLCTVPSLQNGEIDYAILRQTVQANGTKPAILFANIGTTMRGAVDDVGKMLALLRELGVNDCYVHADAALSGAILPFINKSQAHSFADGIDSIAISGHKFIGAPIPCGVVVARKGHVDRISRIIEYIDAPDKTILGSRNGITPLVLWCAIKALGRRGLAERVEECIRKAEYAVSEFNARGIKAWRNPNSITVVFPKPSESLWRKWCLANAGPWAHMITSHHVPRSRIDQLIDEVVADSARGST